jgi:hypothetical protein
MLRLSQGELRTGIAGQPRLGMNEGSLRSFRAVFRIQCKLDLARSGIRLARPRRDAMLEKRRTFVSEGPGQNVVDV